MNSLSVPIPINTTLASAGIESWLNMTSSDSNEQGCVYWADPNHALFQVANLCLFMSYLAPNGIYGILFLRIVLFLAGVNFVLWGILVLCSLDTFLWNFAFAIINFIQSCIILYQLRPLKFAPEYENIYKSLFKKAKVSRHLFKKLIDLKPVPHTLEAGEYFAKEGCTNVGTLSLLVQGRVLVTMKDKVLHTIDEYQFLESPEYVALHHEDDTFKVTVKALEKCSYISWRRNKLKKLLTKEPFLSAVFDNMIGRDIAEKLFLLNQRFMGTSRSLEQLHQSNLCDIETEIYSTCRKTISMLGIDKTDQQSSTANLAAKSELLLPIMAGAALHAQNPGRRHSIHNLYNLSVLNAPSFLSTDKTLANSNVHDSGTSPLKDGDTISLELTGNTDGSERPLIQKDSESLV